MTNIKQLRPYTIVLKYMYDKLKTREWKFSLFNYNIKAYKNNSTIRAL